MKSNIIRENEAVAYISVLTDLGAENENPADWIADQIPDDPDIGFAGFGHKDGLRGHLKWMLGEPKNIELIDKNNAMVAVEEAVRKCLSVINPPKPLHIFVFPTSDNFAKEKMGGVSGYSPWRNTILAYINPVDGWPTALKSTVCHEFAHAVAQNYNELRTILDQLVFDGVAEHFREAVMDGGKAPWVNALPESDAKKILNEIKDKLDSDSEDIRREIFYGAGEYPLWAGYAIGYFIVGKFLKKHKADWNEILKMPPKKVLEESEFLPYS